MRAFGNDFASRRLPVESTEDGLLASGMPFNES
jgi:hypothetical protein